MEIIYPQIIPHVLQIDRVLKTVNPDPRAIYSQIVIKKKNSFENWEV